MLAFLVSVKQQRGLKIRSHRVQQSQITTPTGSIPNAYNGYLRIPDPQRWSSSHHSHDISVALAILLLKILSKYIIIIHLRVFFIFKRFPIGFKENLREEDNLSTKDNWPVPKVSLLRRFYCTCTVPLEYCSATAPPPEY